LVAGVRKSVIEACTQHEANGRSAREMTARIKFIEGEKEETKQIVQLLLRMLRQVSCGGAKKGECYKLKARSGTVRTLAKSDC
jgi:hypothetical protein